MNASNPDHHHHTAPGFTHQNQPFDHHHMPPAGFKHHISDENPTQGLFHHHHQYKLEIGPWSSSLCDCCSDCSSCCLTCWCPCVVFGRIAEIVEQGSSSCCVSGALYCFILSLTGCGCIYSSCFRADIRQDYMLSGSLCNDCCVHCCCEGCALAQEYRELKSRGFDMSLGWQGNLERQNNREVERAPSVPVMEESKKR